MVRGRDQLYSSIPGAGRDSTSFSRTSRCMLDDVGVLTPDLWAEGLSPQLLCQPAALNRCLNLLLSFLEVLRSSLALHM